MFDIVSNPGRRLWESSNSSICPPILITSIRDYGYSNPNEFLLANDYEDNDVEDIGVIQVKRSFNNYSDLLGISKVKNEELFNSLCRNYMFSGFETLIALSGNTNYKSICDLMLITETSLNTDTDLINLSSISNSVKWYYALCRGYSERGYCFLISKDNDFLKEFDSKLIDDDYNLIAIF
jgi:hypothetical protein